MDLIAEQLATDGGVTAADRTRLSEAGEDKNSASFRWTTRRYQEDVKAARDLLASLIEPRSRAHWEAWMACFEEWIGGLLERMRGTNPEEVKAQELYKASKGYEACELAFETYERNKGVTPATMEYQEMLRFIEGVYGEDEESHTRESMAIAMLEGLTRPPDMERLGKWLKMVSMAVQSLAMPWSEVREGSMQGLAQVAWRVIIAGMTDAERGAHTQSDMRRTMDWDLLDRLCAAQVQDRMARASTSWSQTPKVVLAVPPAPGVGESGDRRKCRKCKRTGHLQRDCPSKTAGAGKA